MSKNLDQMLVELEDYINNEQVFREEESDVGNLSLVKEMTFGSSEIIEKDDNNSEVQSEVMSDLHKKQSGLYYKIDNHFSLMPLVTHFNNWIHQDKLIFGVHYFSDFMKAFEQVLSLAAYYENKENKRTLIISERVTMKDSSLDIEEINIDQVIAEKAGDCLHFIGFSALMTLEGIELEKFMKKMKSDFDLVFIVFPKDMLVMNQSLMRMLLLECSNITYFLNKNKNKLKEIEKIRDFYQKTGVEEGGAILGSVS